MTEMISYKQNLQKIGINPGTSVFYKPAPVRENTTYFYSRPNSLRQAIRAMLPPPHIGEPPYGRDHVDDSGYDINVECQGIATDGKYWYLTSNPNLDILSASNGMYWKMIYVLPMGPIAREKIDWNRSVKIALPGHVGQVAYYQYKDQDHGQIFVGYYEESGDPAKCFAQIIAYDVDDGYLSNPNPITLTPFQKNPDYYCWKLEFQAINPWDELFYCQDTNDPVNPPAFWTYDRTGKRIGNFKMSTPALNAQGACFSNNGHLYVSCLDDEVGNSDCTIIRIYSALSGVFLGVIPVAKDAEGHEMEGICFWDNIPYGEYRTQLHLVVLENGLDNSGDEIDVRHYGGDPPELV
jgi:hypothetical protein